jgi:hypothetical protein
LKNKKISLEEIFKTVVQEMSADGSIAGFAAPSIVDDKKKKYAMDEDDSNSESIDKTFEAGEYEVTRAFRGDKKGYTLMISSKKSKGKAFINDKKLQALAKYLEKGF